MPPVPFGFVGPTYPSQSLLLDAQRCINLYPERDETQMGKAKYAMMNCPGLKAYGGTGTGTGVGRGSIAVQRLGRVFHVMGGSLLEQSSNGATTVRGSLTYTTGLVTIDVNATATQLFIVEPNAAGGKAYCYTLATNTLTNVTASLAGTPYLGAWCDGFFICLFSNSNQWQVSAINDCTTWDPTQVTSPSVFSDQIVGLKVIHRQVWFFGSFNTAVYYNAGTSPFPFQLDSSAAIEHGACSNWSIQVLDNTLFFLGIDRQGRGSVWRMNGYIPVRVSTFAVENALAAYLSTHPAGGSLETLSTADALAYEEKGHAFYGLSLPASGSAPGMETSWYYDVTEGMWHERAQYSGSAYSVHPAITVCCGFDRIIVTDRYGTGNIYEMGTYVPADTGATYTSIRRERRSPTVANGNVWQRWPGLELSIDGDAGRSVTLNGYDDLSGTPVWSQTRAIPSATGKNSNRIPFWRLGRTRSRYVGVVITDPNTATVGSKIVDAYLRTP